MINNLDYSKYSDSDRNLLERALAYAEAQGWTLDQFAYESGVHASNLQKVYQGKYEASASNIIAKLSPLADRVDGLTIEFVRTVITERFELTLQCCRQTGDMGAIVADTGRGKTLTCSRWAAKQPPGTAFYLQVPSGCTRVRLATLIGTAMGIPIAGFKEPEREPQLFATLRSRHMLIVDEAGYLVRTARNTEPIRLLQDLHDTCGCPIVCIFRTPHWTEFCNGRHASEDAQLRGRMQHRTTVKEAIWYRDEVDALLRHYGCPVTDDSMDRARRIVTSGSGLRALVPGLMLARDFSDANGIPFMDAWQKADSYRSQGGDFSKLKTL